MSTIKEAARQAWLDQQTQDSEGGVPDSVSFIYGFIAGYEHLQNAFDDRCKVIELQLEDKKKLQEENSKLRQALKFTTKAAVHLFKPEVPLEKGLPPFFYHTTTYEGDLELIENTKLAVELLKDEDNL